MSGTLIMSGTYYTIKKFEQLGKKIRKCKEQIELQIGLNIEAQY